MHRARAARDVESMRKRCFHCQADIDARATKCPRCKTSFRFTKNFTAICILSSVACYLWIFIPFLKRGIGSLLAGDIVLTEISLTDIIGLGFLGWFLGSLGLALLIAWGIYRDDY